MSWFKYIVGIHLNVTMKKFGNHSTLYFVVNSFILIYHITVLCAWVFQKSLNLFISMCTVMTTSIM